MNRPIIILFVVIAATLILVRFALFNNDETPQQPIPDTLEGVLLPEPRPLKAFNLRDHDGQALGVEQLQGSWTFIFFGYTHCPDICPTALGMLKGLAKRLQQTPEYAQDSRFLFVSVDPKRDTLPHLKQYVQFFNPSFTGATGEKEKIDGLARQLGAMYLFEGDTESDDYIVNHTASIVLIDPQGRWIARLNPPHTVTQLHNDYLQIRRHMQNTTTQD